MLTHDGRTVYHKAFGNRDLGTRVAQQPKDIFRIASQTKAITSLAVHQAERAAPRVAICIRYLCLP